MGGILTEYKIANLEKCYCPALMKLALDQYVKFCVFVFVCIFLVFPPDFLLVDTFASGSGSGTLLI